MNKVRVLCPKCGSLLFYRFDNTSGKSEHKCTRCKEVVQIELKPPNRKWLDI